MRRWRVPGCGSAPSGRRYTIGFDDETTSQVRALASSERISFAEKIRQLVEWGLEAVKGDAKPDDAFASPRHRPVPKTNEVKRAPAGSQNR